MQDRLGANAVPVQLPIGAEAEFLRGIVDLVEMKAIIYHDDLGAEWEETDIPEEMQDARRGVPGEDCSKPSPTRMRSS